MFSIVRTVWRGEKGGFDLASIMTGIIVAGILGAVTATTFLAVIPWFQDKTAKDDLRLIQIAEDSHYTDRGSYGEMSALKANKYLHKTTSTKKVCVDKTTVANSYTAYVTSSSGTIFRISSADSSPVKATSIPANCK